MPKTNNASAKTPVASTKSSGGGRGIKFSRDKERSHLARTAYKVAAKAVETRPTFKCPGCKSCYVFESAYIIHRKSCGLNNCGSCTQTDFSAPTYTELSIIRGDKYSAMNKRKAPFMPAFHLRKLLNVVVDEETGKTEKKWITIKKYANYTDLLDNDGETVIDENGEEPQYIDPTEVNREGDDQSIIDE